MNRRLHLRHTHVVRVAMSCVGAAISVWSCAPSHSVSHTVSRTASGTAAPAAVPTSSGLPAVVISADMHGVLENAERIARIALAGGVPKALVSATAAWRVDGQAGRQTFVRGAGGEQWRIERQGKQLRVAGDGNDATPWRSGPFVARSANENGFLVYDGKRYRGELWFTATDSGVMVVNRLPVEAYLRGVVPLELGTRQPGDRAALEAQTVAARTYTYSRVPAPGSPEPASGWHMVSTVTNQVYGGVEVEHPVVDQAIANTAGYVLQYAGRLIDAPYYSSCGGRTATPREAWRDGGAQPYLQVASDIDMRTGRPYCDISPKNHWTAELNEVQVSAAVLRALQAQGARDPQPLRVREVAIAQRTASGRVNALVFRTDRGDVTVPARDIRTVLQDARGAILSSTYFSVERQSQNGGRVANLVLSGHGNGHGVGMCQWGAIGRARAGQDARTILQFYYPGTTIGFAD